MRPQQQNRRMRGRNNNRKGPNPLTRNYESNGPDVKIRGSAQQVADKYTTLARDAQSAGDRVMAENYLQHAEHYNRIIAAATAQAQAQSPRDNRDDRDFRDSRDIRDDQDENGDDDFRDQPQVRGESGSVRHPANDGSGPQPVIEGMPAEVALEQQPQPDKRRGRGRRPSNSGDAPKTDEGTPSEAASGGGDKAQPKATRRPRRAADAKGKSDGGSGDEEATGGKPLTAAAGE